MRTLLFVITIALSACATTSTANKPINVHAVRMEIKDQIETQPGEPGQRKIVSVGKVRQDTAIVYTQLPGQPRQEETWVKGPSGWAMSGAVAVQ